MRCGVEKPLDQFPPVRRGEAKLQSWCRACFAEVNGAYYARNREREKARLVAQTNARREETRRNIILYLLAHPCVDCGERDVVVLEFDHRSNKIAHVTTYANSGRTWPKVLLEIQKCDVRCANCHRRETVRRMAVGSRTAIRPRALVQLDFGALTEIRRCRVCEESKPLAQFPLRSLRDGTRHWICLSCQRAAAKTWYERSVGRPVRKQRSRRPAARQRARSAVFAYLDVHPCVDCGERDPLVLDFDHRSDKIAEVSVLVGRGADWTTIAEEIAKCEVRCANCHRRRTAERAGGYRFKATTATREGLEPSALTFVV